MPNTDALLYTRTTTSCNDADYWAIHHVFNREQDDDLAVIKPNNSDNTGHGDPCVASKGGGGVKERGGGGGWVSILYKWTGLIRHGIHY